MSEFDPNAFLAQSEQPQAPMPQNQGGMPPDESGGQGFDPDAFLKDSEEQEYDTLGHTAKAAALGVAKGVLGPIATYGEKHLLHMKSQDILAEQEHHPIVHAAGEVAGLVGSSIAGVGEGAILSKAGEAAAAVSGLGKATEGASLGYKVGSEAVKQAAEMAVMQSGDEVSKKILSDPKASSESAVANIGLAAALGAGFGATSSGTGALWKATLGPKFAEGLSGFRNYLDGGTAVLPDELKAAKDTLGVEVAPEVSAAMSGDPTAVGHFNILKEGQNRKIAEGIEKFHNDAAESVVNSLGVAPEDVAVRNLGDEASDIKSAFKEGYKNKYGTMADDYAKKQTEAGKIMLPDEARLAKYGDLLESGMTKVGTDSPLYKLYNDYGQRLLAKDSIAGVDQLRTEIGGEIDKAIRAADTNSLGALKDIRTKLGEFQDQMIEKEAMKSGAPGAEALGADAIAERQALSQRYKDFATQSNELADHFGIGRFRGYKDLVNKIDGLSSEQLLNKFSFKNNADAIPFLKEYLPEVYDKVRESELKQFIKPAVLSAKGEAPVNIKKLNDLVAKAMANDKNYVEAILPQDAIQKIQAAAKLSEAIPNPKSSGTAGWMTKMFKDMPRNAVAVVGALTQHGLGARIEGGMMGMLLGELGQKLTRDAPDALRLAHLKFLGSEQPVKAEAFKAMVDYMTATYKGETMLAKASAGVFKSGRQVMTENMMPDAKTRDKLDKEVTSLQKTPDKMMNHQADSNLGHYLPDHQTGMTQTTTTAMQYLQQIKPQPFQPSPLDRPIDPTPAEMARYHRALDIAQQPAVVLQHIKDGTLQPTDIADLKAMYPSTYQNIAQKLTNEMTTNVAGEEPIPYKTRIGLSLFLGQPLDSSMTPQAIMAAQPQPKQPPPPQQGGSKGGSVKALGKSNSNYMTPNQSSEAHKAQKD